MQKFTCVAEILTKVAEVTFYTHPVHIAKHNILLLKTDRSCQTAYFKDYI